MRTRPKDSLRKLSLETYKNSAYAVEVGEDTSIGVFHVKVEDILGADYVKVVVNLIGASIDVEMIPDLRITLSPGQSQKLGPYIFSYDHYFGGAVVSLRNPCGKTLKSARLSSGLVSGLLYYGGVMVGIENMASDRTATFFAFVGEEKIPRVEKVANLLVSVSSEGGKQYVPMTADVTVQNIGTVSISNVFLRFIPRNVEVLSGKEMFIREIKPGEKKAFRVELLPHRSGNLTLLKRSSG